MASLKGTQDKSQSTVTILRHENGESGEVPVATSAARSFINKLKMRHYTKFEVFLVVIVLVLLLALLLVVFVVEEKPGGNENSFKMMTKTEGLVENIAHILENLNNNVDPCNDFYQYACGGWETKNYIEGSQKFVFPFIQVQKKNRRQLKEILESEDIKSMYSTKPFMIKLFQLYSSCVNMETNEAYGENDFQNLLAELSDFNMTKNRSSTYDWPNFVVKMKRQLNIDAFFKTDVLDDLKNSTFRRITIRPLSLPLTYNLYEGNLTDVEKESRERYLEFMTDVLLLLTTTKNRTFVREEARKVFELEAAVAKSQRVMYRNNSLISIEELSKMTSQFDWLSFFSNLTAGGGYTLTPQELLFIITPGMMRNISIQLKRTEPSTIANYLSWRIIIGLIKILPSKFVKKYAIYKYGDVTARWDVCVHHVTRVFPLETTILFEQRALPEGTLNGAKGLLQNIFDVFIGLIPRQTWMDKNTRQGALLKARSMLYHIAYPDNVTRKIFSHDEFVIDTSYIRTYKNMQSFLTMMEMKSLKSAKDRNEYLEKDPMTPNAFYYRTFNKIEIAAGFLHETFFSLKNYQSTNFATIGMVFGHEILHGFDSTGMNFNEIGIQKRWMSMTSSKAVVNKHLCLQTLYSNFTHNGEKIGHVGDYRQQYCDSGGVMLAFKAYQEWKEQNKEQQMLPGVNLTHNQLFFISYAQMWCAKYKDSEYKQMLKAGKYPFPLRVQGVIMNSKEFAETFSCARDAAMIPSKRCPAWET